MKRRICIIIIVLNGLFCAVARAGSLADGEKLFNAGDYYGAAMAFTDAILMFPSNAGLYILRGVTLARLGDYDRALQDYDRAIKLDPGSLFYDSPWPDRADLAGTDSLRLEAYYRPIKLYPKSLAYLGRGQAHAALGETDLAIRDYDKAVEFYPQNAEAFLNRGFAYAKIGNKPQAVRDWIQAANLNNARAIALLKEKGMKW